MTFLRVITILLPLFLMAVAFETPKVRHASYLDAIYYLCGTPRARTFCLGGKENKTSFPGGQGCLKDKNCEILVHASPMEDSASEGFEWQFCLRDSTSEVTYVALSIGDGEDTSKTILMVTHEGTDVGVMAKDNNVEYSEQELKNVVAIKEMFKVAAEPSMTCVRFTTPMVMKFPNGVDFDLMNNKMMFTVLGIMNGHQTFLNLKKSIFLFKNVKSSNQKPEQCHSVIPNFLERMKVIRQEFKQCMGDPSAELPKFLEILPLVLQTLLNVTKGD